MSKPDQCTVCRHEMAPAINADVMEGRSIRAIAESYNLSKSAVQRHKVGCMAGDFAAAAEAARLDLEMAATNRNKATAKTQEEQTSRILNGVEMANVVSEVVKHAEDIRKKALDAGQLTTSLMALDKLLKAADSYAKLSAEFREREKLKYDTLRHQWAKLQVAISTALDPYPEAKEAVSNAIAGVGASILS